MIERKEVVDTVVERVREVVPESRDVAVIDDQMDLRGFAGFDSLGILELLVWLEEQFAITIPDEELVVENFNSVGKMADYVIANR
ncbi:MAG TPA: acyl carrier protein [Actinoplanes sp.]|jgi:acyl carrier protein